MDSSYLTPRDIALAQSRKPQKLWLYIVGALIVLTLGYMLPSGLAGKQIPPTAWLYSVLWTGLFFYLLWKRRGREGWHGALLGAVLGYGVFFLIVLLSALIRNKTG